MSAQGDFIPLAVGVLTISDTRTLETDTSGDKIVEFLEGAGHQVVLRKIISDTLTEIENQLGEWIQRKDIQVVITTGGTGITARDNTPEALQKWITKPIPGFGELFRMLSYEEIGTSTIQSRAEGALCGKTLVFCLPGSTGAVTTAMKRVLIAQLDSRHKPCNFATMFPRF